MPEPRSSAPCLRPRLCTGSRGSLVLAVASEEPEALRARIEDFRDGFRKGWFDLSAGFAKFMPPSQAHEFTARDVRDVVMALCHAVRHRTRSNSPSPPAGPGADNGTAPAPTKAPIMLRDPFVVAHHNN